MRPLKPQFVQLVKLLPTPSSDRPADVWTGSIPETGRKGGEGWGEWLWKCGRHMEKERRLKEMSSREEEEEDGDGRHVVLELRTG